MLCFIVASVKEIFFLHYVRSVELWSLMWSPLEDVQYGPTQLVYQSTNGFVIMKRTELCLHLSKNGESIAVISWRAFYCYKLELIWKGLRRQVILFKDYKRVAGKEEENYDSWNTISGRCCVKISRDCTLYHEKVILLVGNRILSFIFLSLDSDALIVSPSITVGGKQNGMFISI